MATDIVVTTCERLALLKQTLQYIWERTQTPYRLHVIDDASTEGNADYLRSLGPHQVHRVYLHEQRVGIPAHLRALTEITESDPVVFTDDDVLCPRLEPDWLARGLEAMKRYPRLGMLALNNPHCNVGGSKRGERVPGNPVTLCRNLPGTFVFARRAVLERFQAPDGTQSAVKWLCLEAAKVGWRIGYLTHVYCQHIGTVSVRKDKDLSGEIALVQPTDPDTLEPPVEYRG